MAKRIISAMTALMLCLGAAGCGDAGGETESDAVRAEEVIGSALEDGEERAYDSSGDASAVYSDDGGDASEEEVVGAEGSGSPEEGARMAYSAVQVYLFDADVLGDKEARDELMFGRFPAAVSEAGLDIGADEPSAEGDRVIYSTMRYAGFTEGAAAVGGYDAGDGRLFVLFTLPDGGSARYPEG